MNTRIKRLVFISIVGAIGAFAAISTLFFSFRNPNGHGHKDSMLSKDNLDLQTVDDSDASDYEEDDDDPHIQQKIKGKNVKEATDPNTYLKKR